MDALNSIQPFYPISYAQSEHVWSYAGKMLIMTRSLMNAAARNARIVTFAGSEFPFRIKDITTKMKLFTIVSIPFALVDLKSSANKLYNNILQKDLEGVGLSALSVAILALDLFDTVTTFVNAALAVGNRDQIQLFSTLGIPVALNLMGLATLSRSIQFTKAYLLYKGKADSKEKELMLQKMKIEALGWLSNVIMTVALLLLKAGNGTPTPYLLLALSFKVRIGSLIYQDYLKPSK